MTPETRQQGQYAFNYRLFVLGLFLTSLFYNNTLYASEQHSHEQIRTAAVDFVRSKIPEDVTIKEITAGKIDSRIHFKQCSQALEMTSTSKKHIAKSWTIGVRCFDTPRWSIYIPVKAKLTRKMLVSQSTITRGEVITADNIKVIEREINNQNYNHFSDIANVAGKEARRTIRPDRVINSTMLQKALMVHKKETVLIYAKNQKLQISMKGTALKNGYYNQMIKVRNNSSKKIIDAVVIDRGVVAVNF
ncbi:MAG: flagellar basal body P-ring formation protein FlgA [gamma proteobacterium symbiont of Bathyaustriella thionipta]|nr:flagellar basal body P-ring formation protein FlgA [gamma proteobacterium symbiont of Bathyaustriella thionipta]MCU7951037.1 flagellar basal body P-ring formation protein FlgA [gamma proteobacterium symbiont of Bathyaustriella thionipta]MCU7951892.1 flagellar basal body P-ring formation protein FlgA [gamma proteobacterium symbiont of Bathyaustriella thionipta]MCU7957542.1 flagellar basal body P-ring formation protein FlgA [gamma proteobacterium symbiont of Bathyaustriella thionipta]MCU796595